MPDQLTIRWTKSEADERAVREGCVFNEARGQYVVDWYEQYLFHTMGEFAGQSFKLLDWQRDGLIMPLFGWQRADGTRRYRKADIFVAKKNGKSTLCAGLASYFMLADNMPRAQVYGAAYTREQAGIVYQEAAAMVKASPHICRAFTCNDTKKRITCSETGAFFQALAGEAGPVEGVIAHAIIFDEIHVQKDQRLWNALTYANVSQASKQPMTISISTVGVANRESIWWARYEYAKGILAGTITDHSAFAYVAQADEECAANVELAGDGRQWHKANPSLGHTLSLDRFKEDYTEARNSPVMFNAFLRYRLNVPTQQEERMIPMDAWDECGGEVPDLTGRPCCGGLDLADTNDVCAFVLWFPPHGDDEHEYCLSWFWCPAGVIQERIDAGKGFYDVWRRQELLRLTEGVYDNHIDQGQIVRDVQEICERYEVKEIGYDAWNAGDVAGHLEQYGVPMVKVQQSMSGLAFGTKKFMEAISTRRLRHGGNPVLTWMAANAAGVMDHAGNIRPAKDKSADKIDGIVAAIIACGRAMLQVKTESVYDRREMIVL